MENIRYWTFKHKPGGKANEDRCKELILQAVRNNYAFMQYEYGGNQDQGMVTQNWNRMLEVSEGDVIFLRGDKKIYAYGNAIRPRLEADKKLKIKDIIDEKDHGKYHSSKYRGIIHFEDSDVFYENLDGEGNWGQRIDVDSWRFFYAEGITAQSQDFYKPGENEYGVLKELKPEKGEEIINELYKKSGMKGDVLSLLKSNHNLILTGAPGTGKTYLAKQVTRLLLFGKTNENELNDDEKKLFEEQSEFVQFHPNYDYTDFVEGLRPIQDESGNLGFERKDGVFKEFCKKALLANSNIKDNATVKQEFDSAWDKLLNEVRTNLAIGKMTKIGIWDYGLSSVNSLKYTSTTAPSKYTFTINKNNVYDAYRGLQARPSGYFQKYIEDVVTYMNEKHGLKKYEVPQKNITNGKAPSFVFIIDEINRGEISKIFGELFFSIDPGYRGTDGKVRTQYANMQTEPNEFDAALKITDINNYGHFFVPENVYIIGTMNDIDRSVESMDFAFRRRFAFKEIKAEETLNMLGKEESWKDEKENIVPPAKETIAIIKNRIKNLNNAIWNEKTKSGIEGLSSAYHIGASYFLKLANYRNDKGEYVAQSFIDLWDNHLDGLLREYMRGMQNVDEKMESLKAAYNNESNPDN